MSPYRRCLLAWPALALPVLSAVEDASRHLTFGGTFTADPSNPGLETTLSGMPAGLPALGAPGMVTQEQERLSKESADFVEAMVQSFLHKQKLEKGELDCIVDGSGHLGGNVARTASQAGMVLKQAFGPNLPELPSLPATDGASPTPVHAGAPAPAEPRPAAEPARSRKVVPDASLDFFYDGRRRLAVHDGPRDGAAEGLSDDAPQVGINALPVFLEFGVSMQQMIKETKDLVGECVHSDAQRAFQEAGRHMENATYMTGHVLANGADIVQELADSVQAYETRDVKQFGHDLGRALRKVFLSKNAKGELPEGMPGEEELANVTSGLMRGFFGEGTTMDLHLRRGGRGPVHVDMHDCVRGNLKFFQNAWATTMYLYAQKASRFETKHGKRDLYSNAGKVEFGTTLAFTLMELPAALKKCDISPEQESMIMDSIKTMGTDMHVQFHLPGEAPTKQAMTSGFAQTVKDWSAMEWERFGEDLGGLLQRAVTSYYPQKYLVEHGVLQRAAPADERSAASTALLPALVVLLAGLLGVALRLAVAARQGRYWSQAPTEESDSEDRQSSFHLATESVVE